MQQGPSLRIDGALAIALSKATDFEKSGYSTHGVRWSANSLQPQLSLRLAFITVNLRAIKYEASDSKLANSNGNPPIQSSSSCFALIPLARLSVNNGATAII